MSNATFDTDTFDPVTLEIFWSRLISIADEAAAIFGDDWPPYGLEPNLKMLTDFCQDQYAQKLVGAPVDPVDAFADYTRFAQ